MHITLLLVLVPLALATPLMTPHAILTNDIINANPDQTWAPAANLSVACNATSDKIISFVVGPQLETVLNDACAAMMPPCAYQDRLPADTMCVQTVDFGLTGPRNSTQNANVELADTGNKIAGWAVRFSVIPATSNLTSLAGVFWTKADCYGYLSQIVAEQEPVGCHKSMGSGTGSLKVGGADSLKGTVFKVEIVKRK